MIEHPRLDDAAEIAASVMSKSRSCLSRRQHRRQIAVCVIFVGRYASIRQQAMPYSAASRLAMHRRCAGTIQKLRVCPWRCATQYYYPLVAPFVSLSPGGNANDGTKTNLTRFSFVFPRCISNAFGSHIDIIKLLFHYSCYTFCQFRG